MPTAIELVMRCASADAELTPALGALQDACGAKFVGGMPSAPRGIDLVFRCASADHEYGELDGLKHLRDVSIASGVTRMTTPGGGAFVAQTALEFVLSQTDEVAAFEGLRALVSAETPAPLPQVPPSREANVGVAARSEMGSAAESNGQGADDRRRDMDPAYRLPALSSKPQTPTLHRHRVDADEGLSDALPPITVYDSKQVSERPMSRQYQYRPKPTGEGLARVFSFASRSAERPAGLFALHSAVVAVKRKQPHRLVKIPVGGVWRDRAGLPSLPHQKKPAAADHAAVHTDPAEQTMPRQPQGNPSRLSTAGRINRKLEELRHQVAHLNAVRSTRQSHNAQLTARTGSPTAKSMAGTLTGRLGETLPRTAASPNAALGGTMGSQPHAGRAPGNLRGTTRRHVSSPSAPASALGGTLSGTLTSYPAAGGSVVDAIIASRNGTTKRGQPAAMAVSPPSDPPPANRAPVVPHRGLRAAANPKAIPRQPALYETLL
uniref:Uncharacterized protein n=1 Tax=Neobodo designis TaxID=312471 RepID=A0A7S1M6P1_NEODS